MLCSMSQSLHAAAADFVELHAHWWEYQSEQDPDYGLCFKTHLTVANL